MKTFVYAAALMAVLSATPAMADHDRMRHTTNDLALVQIDENGTQALQQALRDSGFNKRPVTGRWDQNTTNALYSYQEANGLVPTGTLNNETLRQLGLNPSALTKVSGTKAVTDTAPRHRMKYKNRPMAHKDMHHAR